jgi:hypothetical protein
MGNQESFSPKIQNRQDRALTEPNPKMDKIKPNLNTKYIYLFQN